MESRVHDVGGCQLHCLQDLDGERRDVVLLHGMKFSAATWQEVGTLEVLSRAGHRVHALDMPGFGQSPACQIEPVEVLRAYIARQGIVSPVLVGPSMGGRICLNYAFSQPGAIGGLVLVGAVGVDQYRGRYGELIMPCLLVWGGEDAVSPLAGARALEAELPRAGLVVLEGAPHPCYLDQPQAWHEALLGYLRESGF